jgi:hypothetical protein
MNLKFKDYFHKMFLEDPSCLGTWGTVETLLVPESNILLEKLEKQ